MTAARDLADRPVRRLAARLAAADVTDGLAVAVLLADLRERLETMAGRGDVAAGDLAGLELLISAAEAADVIDRPRLLGRLRRDLVRLAADVGAPHGLAA